MDLLANYDFELPEALIATTALHRGSSRLMVLKKGHAQPAHDQFTNIGNYLNAGDVLVINNTKVMKARINAYKPTGGRVELLLVRPLKHGGWATLMNGKGPFLPGMSLMLGEQGGTQWIVIEKKCSDEPGVYEIRSNVDLKDYIEAKGELPLPPYFRRRADANDYDRYQTVYAKHSGAVAAPTAGLHFTSEHLAKLCERGVVIVEVTLHVGPGTFLPIRVDNLDEHKMHAEYFTLGADAAHALNDARTKGHRIIPVGTTSLRVIEQVMLWAHEQDHRHFFACEGSTALFCRPGFRFLAADALITNFHLPRSTLLALVSAFVGRDRILNAYKEAIAQGYRFFSYGDASYLELEA